MGSRSLEVYASDSPEIPERVRSVLSRGESVAVSFEGSAWARAGQWILRCPSGDGAEACLRDLSRAGREPGSPEEAWLAILLGCPEEEADRLTRRFQLSAVQSARVIVFIPRQEGNARLPESFRELTPLECGDVLLPRGEGQMILIKRTGDRSETEVTEYASALLETMESEAGLRCLCGIGNEARQRRELAGSYQQALESIRTGTRFHLEAPVYLYRDQTLERLMDTIPEESRQRLREEVFHPELPLSPELMETAQTFFRNDLNLTTTAKELFIHRNTLLYRLERIRRETGLDIRSFHDAVIFKTLSEI